MIYTPEWSQAPVETLLMAGLGFVAGKVFNVNAELVATIAAVSTVANYLLFTVATRWIAPRLHEMQSWIDVSDELTYTITCALVSVITCIAMNQFDLISRRLAGILIFGSLAAFTGRLRIIYG